ncbi:unnamed protein product [Trichogramma brassicae]|uniref:Uncharacterized protein n=1 Tax=Trichogramma brassicae TaxID=86971 RepID=A0A6H5IBR7_9HYME|nr:unnamed protein product [Trichogramma brassicae]
MPNDCSTVARRFSYLSTGAADTNRSVVAWFIFHGRHVIEPISYFNRKDEINKWILHTKFLKFLKRGRESAPQSPRFPRPPRSPRSRDPAHLLDSRPRSPRCPRVSDSICTAIPAMPSGPEDLRCILVHIGESRGTRASRAPRESRRSRGSRDLGDRGGRGNRGDCGALENCELHAELARSTWRSVKDKHKRENDNYEFLSAAAGRDKVAEPSWPLWQSLQFLRQADQPTDKRENLDDSIPEKVQGALCEKNMWPSGQEYIRTVESPAPCSSQSQSFSHANLMQQSTNSAATSRTAMQQPKNSMTVAANRAPKDGNVNIDSMYFDAILLHAQCVRQEGQAPHVE